MYMGEEEEEEENIGACWFKGNGAEKERDGKVYARACSDSSAALFFSYPSHVSINLT